MADQFRDYRAELDSPASSAVLLTPHDTNDLATPSRGLYVGTTGNIKVDMFGEGTAVLFTAVPVGVLPIRVTRVYATDTDASTIIALY